MAFFDSLQESKEIVEFLKTNRYFEELREGDTVWRLNIENLEINSSEIEEITIIEEKETDFENSNFFKDKKFEEITYNMVDINLKDSSHSFRVFGKTNIGFGSTNSKYVITTSRKIAEIVKNILLAKCKNQMEGFKRLFHYQGWEYERAPWRN